MIRAIFSVIIARSTSLSLAAGESVMERMHYSMCQCSVGLLALCSASALTLTGMLYILLN
ncbi:hypothetical protein CAF53_20720 [Sphingobium sp. LB126]|uniref:Uncharacterized protein n=1 Tax=Sphingobium chungbukense TaxID=56193 RepID=A0A0M3AKZ5_9SPHN|nr:hypothetical protein YP76_19735 [Sphingobium chungbukense]PJG46573.1 hypothetical protein CAF53_20720 [Sphingobium sp. LB126]